EPAGDERLHGLSRHGRADVDLPLLHGFDHRLRPLLADALGLLHRPRADMQRLGRAFDARFWWWANLPTTTGMLVAVEGVVAALRHVGLAHVDVSPFDRLDDLARGLPEHTLGLLHRPRADVQRVGRALDGGRNRATLPNGTSLRPNLPGPNALGLAGAAL